MRKVKWIWILALIATTYASDPALVEDAIKNSENALRQGNTTAAMQNLIQAIRLQQAYIQSLTGQVQEQQKTIEEQKLLLEKQQTEYEKKISELKETAPTVDSYGALLQYKKAYSIQHIAIFDVRKKDAPPYFRKAIEEYRVVVDKYPNSEKAPDALFHIGKLYIRYLKEYDKGRAALEELFKRYPQSEFVEDARDLLENLPVK